MFIVIAIGTQLIVEVWSWTDRVSVIGVWDAAETSQAYENMRSCIVANLALTTMSLVLLCRPSYSDSLARKPWSRVDFRRILAVMVLTGGTVYTHPTFHKYCLRYYGKSIVLHQIFCRLIERAYNLITEPARCTTRGSYLTQIYRKDIVEDLLELCPNYNTRNGCHNGREYDIPRANFLLNAPLDVVQEAVRLAVSANGCIRYTIEPISGSNGCHHVRPQFTFGYLSPEPLLNDYQAALDRVEIHATPVTDRRFGRGFLLGRSWNTLAAFSSLGGFIDGVKINRGKHRGLSMNDVLQGLLMLKRDVNNNFSTREKALQTAEAYIENGKLIESSHDTQTNPSPRSLVAEILLR